MSFWKNDNFFIGATVAMVLTGITLLLLMLLVPFIYSSFNLGVANPKILLCAIIPPIVMMRYYLRKLHYGKSGAGSLFLVFIAMLFYFLLLAGKLESFPALLN